MYGLFRRCGVWGVWRIRRRPTCQEFRRLIFEACVVRERLLQSPFGVVAIGIVEQATVNVVWCPQEYDFLDAHLSD